MKFRAFHALAAKVDRAAGIIYGASIISAGAAKGHGVLIDGTTLSQVKGCIEQQYKSGLKIKFNPETFDHGTGGIPGIVPIDSLSMSEGTGQVLGDIHLFASYPADKKEYLFEMAEKCPDTFGLSIDFEGDPEDVNGVEYARCTSIDAATIVDQPAANSGGLFRVLSDTQTPATKPKDQAMPKLSADEVKQFSDIVTEAIAPLTARIDKMESAQAVEAAPDCAGMSKEQIDDEEMSAGVVATDSAPVKYRKVNTFRATQRKPATVADITETVNRAVTNIFKTAGGQPFRHNFGGNGGGSAKQGFSAKVDELKGTGLSQAAATMAAIRNFPELYREHCDTRTDAAAKTKKAAVAA